MSGKTSQLSPCRAIPLCSFVSAALIYRAPLMTAFLHEKVSRVGISHCEDCYFSQVRKNKLNNDRVKNF